MTEPGGVWVVAFGVPPGGTPAKGRINYLLRVAKKMGLRAKLVRVPTEEELAALGEGWELLLPEADVKRLRKEAEKTHSATQGGLGMDTAAIAVVRQRLRDHQTRVMELEDLLEMLTGGPEEPAAEEEAEPEGKPEGKPRGKARAPRATAAAPAGVADARGKLLRLLSDSGPLRTAELLVMTGWPKPRLNNALQDCPYFAKEGNQRSPWSLTDEGRKALAALPPA
jgi:hypothetical protein